MKAPTDSRVVDHVNKMVDEGVQNVSEMQRHVNIFVKQIFVNQSLPKAINRRFYPSRADLRQMIYRRRCSNLKGLLDQESVLQKIGNWSSNHPEDFWFYRMSTSSAVEDEDVDGSTKLLLVHQTEWQRKLLLRYGQDLVFLDATYKTSKYAIPLYFLCIHSNCGYIVVAVLSMENEDSTSLAEGLKLLSEKVPSWNPRAFMIDASEMEFNAIHSIFPGKCLEC